MRYCESATVSRLLRGGFLISSGLGVVAFLALRECSDAVLGNGTQYEYQRLGGLIIAVSTTHAIDCIAKQRAQYLGMRLRFVLFL